MKEIIGYSMAHVPIPKMEEEQETRLVVYYDIQDISAPTTICTNYDSSIKSIEVDGVLLDSVVTTYQFDSVGEHIIKYEFNDPTTVGNNAPLFSSIATIKHVVIADTFTSIGNYAFYDCTGLTSVTIPNSVTSIGDYAFGGCSGLSSVTIPNSVTSIGSSAFYGCSGLKSIVIGSGVTSIPDYSLYTGKSIESLTIGSSVLSISYVAFSATRNSSGAKPVKTIWLTNTPPTNYSYAAGTVNYVANNLLLLSAKNQMNIKNLPQCR